VGEVDGAYFSPTGGYEGAAINHVFTGDFDVVIKLTGNGHTGTGMLFGPQVQPGVEKDFCTFNGAYMHGNYKHGNLRYGKGGGEGDTGYGCRSWAEASTYTGGYNFPETVHATYHAGGHVIYARFQRIGNKLYQYYSGGGGTSRDAPSKRADFAMPSLDAGTTECSPDVVETSPCWSRQTHYMGTGIDIAPGDGVLIVMGEASSCHANRLEGPAPTWRHADKCPFIIKKAIF
jgi:hypothetical protein